ncbi:hypothetical protein V6N13_082592 [Hibiscus sabdariffa]
MPLHQWFVLNLVGPFPGGCDHSSWDLLFAVVIWNLWCQRNASVFGSTDETWGSIIGRSRWLADSTKKALAERHSRMQLNSNVSRPISRWFTPPVGWIKLNTDGECSFPNGASITLVRDIRRLCSQDWQVSFHHVLRIGNRVVDALAKLVESSSFDILHFVNPPLCVDRSYRRIVPLLFELTVLLVTMCTLFPR